jgi:two-component system sensor kinase FixL
LLSTAVFTRRSVLLTSALCLALTALAYALSHVATFSGPASGRLLVSLAAIAISACLALKSMAATDVLLMREQALRRSEAFLAGSQRISQTGSFSLRARDCAMTWSNETARIFGYADDVAPSVDRIVERTLPEDRGIVRGAVDRALHSGGVIDLRHCLLLPDGEQRYVHVLAHPMIDSAGRREYMGALRDVTGAVLAEQELHRSRVQLAHVTRVTMLGELAASIAHEVNQPLAAIVANGDAALRWLNRPRPELE